jgi:hypothetical protein
LIAGFIIEHGISILRDIGSESDERWKSDSVIVVTTSGEKPERAKDTGHSVEI